MRPNLSQVIPKVPKKKGSLKNALEQLYRAKTELAIELVEQCQDYWPEINMALIDRARDGNVTAIALLYSIVLPDKNTMNVTIENKDSNVGNYSTHELIELCVAYKSFMGDKGQKEGLINVSPHIKPHPSILPPPPLDIGTFPLAGKPETETPVVYEARASEPIKPIDPLDELHFTSQINSRRDTNEQ